MSEAGVGAMMTDATSAHVVGRAFRGIRRLLKHRRRHCPLTTRPRLRIQDTAAARDLEDLLEEIRSGSYEPPPDLLKLAEDVIRSQQYAPKTPEEIHAWAERLAADFVAAGEAEGWR